MSLYDGLGIENNQSKATGWSPSFQMLKSQLQVKLNFGQSLKQLFQIFFYNTVFDLEKSQLVVVVLSFIS